MLTIHLSFQTAVAGDGIKQPVPDFIQLYKDICASISSRPCMKAKIIEIRDFLQLIRQMADVCFTKMEEGEIAPCIENILVMFKARNERWLEMEKTSGKTCKAFSTQREKIATYMNADFDVFSKALVAFSKMTLPKNSVDVDEAEVDSNEDVKELERELMTSDKSPAKAVREEQAARSFQSMATVSIFSYRFS